MTRKDLETGISLLENIKEIEGIISKLQSQKIRHIQLADGSSVSFLPRGIIKEVIIENCEKRIEEYELKISELGSSLTPFE